MDIKRFYESHDMYYNLALKEIKNGKKRSHWMWYIFPQLKGLGKSYNSIYYGLNDYDEAYLYYNDSTLHNHLIEICKVLLKQNDNVENIFGYPDYIKLQSCLTLFSIIDKDNILFIDLINKFYNGKLDNKTIKLLKK